MPFNYNTAKFWRAYGTAAQLEPSTYPEVAFCGRSNVGKSSLLNKLMGRKQLAKTSSTPGKTATINFFQVEKAFFVDLPGYGYAKVPKSEKARWGELIEGYFAQDRRFALVCSLIDIRLPPQKLDLHMVGYLQERGLPFVCVLTKGDKLGTNARASQAAALREGFELPEDVPMLVTSAAKGDGIAELRKLIEKACRECPK